MEHRFSLVMRTLICFTLIGLVAETAQATPSYWYAQDSFGYVGTNDVSYQWLYADPGVPPTPLVLQDEDAGVVALPQAFEFYGVDYTHLIVHSNGLIELTNNPPNVPSSYQTTPINTYIPNPNAPNAFLAPFWDDLNANSAIRAYPASTVNGPGYAVTFANATIFSDPTSPLTFQVYFDFSDNSIRYHYQRVPATFRGSGSSATIGIENAGTPGEGLLYGFNQPNKVENLFAVGFFPPTSGSLPTPLPATPTPAATATPGPGTPTPAPGSVNLNLQGINADAFPEIFAQFSLQDATTNSPILNAPASQFTVAEENSAVPINAFFGQGNDIKTSIALVLDTSGSMSSDLDTIGRLSSHFIYNTSCTDEIALVSFEADVTLEHDFTTDKDAIDARLRGLRSGGATAFYESVCYAVTQLNWPSRSNRAVIVLTDGQDNASDLPCTYLTETIRTAAQNGIPVYTIGLGSSVSQYELALLAQGTGGMSYMVNSTLDIGAVYASIAEQLAATYSLTYTSPSPAMMPIADRNVTVAYPGGLASDDRTYVPGAPCVFNYNNGPETGLLPLGGAGLVAQELHNTTGAPVDIDAVEVFISSSGVTEVVAELWSYDTTTMEPDMLLAISPSVVVSCQGWWSFDFVPQTINSYQSPGNAVFLVLRQVGGSDALIGTSGSAAMAPGEVLTGIIDPLGYSWATPVMGTDILFRASACGGSGPTQPTPTPFMTTTPNPTNTPVGGTPTPTPACYEMVSGRPVPATCTPTPISGCYEVISGIPRPVTCTPTPVQSTPTATPTSQAPTATPTPPGPTMTPGCYEMVSGRPVPVTCTPTPISGCYEVISGVPRPVTCTPTPTLTPVPPTNTPQPTPLPFANITMISDPVQSGGMYELQMRIVNDYEQRVAGLFVGLEAAGAFYFLDSLEPSLSMDPLPLVPAKAFGSPTLPVMNIPTTTLLSFPLSVPVNQPTTIARWYAAFLTEGDLQLVSNVAVADVIVTP